MNLKPSQELIPIILDIQIFEGFKSIHENLVFFAKNDESIQKKFRDEFQLNATTSRSFIKSCLVQKIFSTAPDNVYFGVYNPSEVAITGEASGIINKIAKIVESLPVPDAAQNLERDTIMNSTLNFNDIKEGYDFTISIPGQGDYDFDLYDMIRAALEIMVATVERSKMNVQEKTLLAGGKGVFYFPKSLFKYTRTMLKLVNFLQQAGHINLQDFDEDDSELCGEKFCLLLSKKILDLLKDKSNVLYDFIVLLGLKSDGSLNSAPVIRHNIPHVLFYTRICVKYVDLKDNKYMPEEWLNLFSSTDPTSSIAALQRLMKYLDSFGTEGLENNIYWKRNNQNVMDFMNIQIEDVSISLYQLREGIQKVFNEADKLVRVLFMDQEIPEINLDYSDSLRDTKAGSSFESPQLKKTFSEITNSLEWINKFRKKDNWDIKKVKSWIKDCDQLGEVLLFLTHLIYGQPARGTELSHMQLLNSKTIQRSIFIIDKQVCLVQG